VPEPATPAIAAAASTPDETGFVSIIGQTYRKAQVRLALQANGPIVQTIRADAKGWFHFNTTVGYGRTPLRLFVTAPGHRRTSMILPVVRVMPQANPAPPRRRRTIPRARLGPPRQALRGETCLH
jgi:hypothetical protein